MADEILYTSIVDVTGGRTGRIVARSGSIDMHLSRPAERGGSGGTDPEELFAAGLAACFDSALSSVARTERLRIGKTRTTAEVTLHRTPEHDYYISALVRVDAPASTAADLARALTLAKGTCPYSKAVSGNVDMAVYGTSSEGPVEV